MKYIITLVLLVLASLVLVFLLLWAQPELGKILFKSGAQPIAVQCATP